MTRAEAEAWGRGDTRRVATRDFPFEVRCLVDIRQGGRFCAECRKAGRTPPVDMALVLDHQRPLSRGGDNNYMNLRWLCAGCNASRGARPSALHAPRWSRGPR